MKKKTKSPRRVKDTDGEPLTRRSALKKIGAVMAGSMIGAGMIGAPAEGPEILQHGRFGHRQ